jgi:hypothetical protein
MLSWTKRSLLVWPLAMIAMVGSSWPSAEAFVTGPRFPVRQHSRTAAPLAGFLDDIGQFFDELSEKKSKGSLKDGTSKLSTDSSIRDETDFTANYQIISIPGQCRRPIDSNSALKNITMHWFVQKFVLSECGICMVLMHFSFALL